MRCGSSARCVSSQLAIHLARIHPGAGVAAYVLTGADRPGSRRVSDPRWSDEGADQLPDVWLPVREGRGAVAVQLA